MSCRSPGIRRSVRATRGFPAAAKPGGRTWWFSNARPVSSDCGGPDSGLAFAAPPLIRSGPVEPELIGRIASILRIGRDDIVDAQWADNGPGWVAVLLDSADAVLALRPGEVDIDVGVAGPYPAGSPEAFEVRAFTPKLGGVGEDPVTGSLNASLAGWLLDTGRATAPVRGQPGHGARPPGAGAHLP